MSITLYMVLWGLTLMLLAQPFLLLSAFRIGRHKYAVNLFSFL